MRRIIYLSGAQADYDHELEWYNSRSSAAGDEFEAEVDRALAAIMKTPETWAREGRKHRRYSLGNFPFSIIYRIDADAIVIVAIAHASRRPGYWKSRK